MLLPKGLPGVTNESTQKAGIRHEQDHERPAGVGGVDAGQREAGERETQIEQQL